MRGGSMKRLFGPAVTSTILTVVAAFAASALEKSLPYRIGFADYSRYLWVERLFWISVGLASVTVVLACVVQKASLALTAILGSFIFFATPDWVHSGPNPQRWCYFNLRGMDVE